MLNFIGIFWFIFKSAIIFEVEGVGTYYLIVMPVYMGYKYGVKIKRI